MTKIMPRFALLDFLLAVAVCGLGVPFPAVPGAVGHVGVVSLLCGLSVQALHLAGDGLYDLGHLHHRPHLLVGVQGQQVEELLQGRLGVLEVGVDRDPNVLIKNISK